MEYINYEMCKKCKGVCCKENGCIYLPRDFKNLNIEYLKKLLSRGNISISGQPFPIFNNEAWTYLLYIRARNKNAKIIDLFTEGGPCTLLTKNGCKLKEEERPSLGLLIKPTRIGGPCERLYTSDDTLTWTDYNETLVQLIKYYTNEDFIKTIIKQLDTRINSIQEKIEKLKQLKEMEKALINWYETIIVDKPFYTIEEIKKMHIL